MTNKEAYELVRSDWKPGHHLIDLWLYQYNRKYMRLIRKCIQHEKKKAKAKAIRQRRAGGKRDKETRRAWAGSPGRAAGCY